MSNMVATLLMRRRTTEHDGAFAEYVIWEIPKALLGSSHNYKYRLAYVVENVCVLRYDNEAGKGDHRHFGADEGPYSFSTPRKLVTDFQQDMARWKHENGHS